MAFLIATFFLPTASPAQTSQIIPPPTSHPLYRRIPELLKRMEECAQEQREAERARAERAIYLPEPERSEAMARHTALVKESVECQREAERELLDQTLPGLERACASSGDVACAQWASNQRIWRQELPKAWLLAVGIIADCEAITLREAALLLTPQQLSRPGYMAAARAQCRASAHPLLERVRFLKAAIAGRDLLAEERQARAARLIALTESARRLVQAPVGPPDLDHVLEDTKARADAARSLVNSPEPGVPVKPLLDAVDSLVEAWSRERAVQNEVARLTRQRDQAKATVETRASYVTRFVLDVAEQNLKRALTDQEEARRERERRQESVRRLLEGG